MLFVIFVGVVSLTAQAKVDVIRATIKIPVCGDGLIDSGEQCDNLNFNNATCQSRGFSSGFLICKFDCSLDTTNCMTAPASNGGGGGTYVSPETSVTISGRAYPGSAVTLLKDAQIAMTTISGPDAIFKMTLVGLSPGSYIFSVYSEDDSNERSSFFTFPTTLTSGAQSQISGVFISPTLRTNKQVYKKGETAILYGQTNPSAQVIITINSETQRFAKVNSDKSGAYLYNLDTTDFEIGNHAARSKSAIGSEISSYSKTIGFVVGMGNIVLPATSTKDETLLNGKTCTTLKRGDFNCDAKINLVDFSIWLYWFKSPTWPKYIDINKNGKIDLSDFSILIYNWTG